MEAAKYGLPRPEWWLRRRFSVKQLAANFPQNLEVSQPRKTSRGQHGERVPIKRPDGGGCIGENQSTLQVNHFRVKFDRDVVILQYGIEIERKIEPNPNASPKVSKIEALLVKSEYFRRMLATAYDGGKEEHLQCKPAF
ncbi:protein argonaute 2-like [Aristolochia californica]|uniref:protein argonaute 2-like n=1 Tax=Aristolochia californica TaxID=171875 RepID=UPI0035D9E089